MGGRFGVDVFRSDNDHGVRHGQIAHGAGLVGDETAGHPGGPSGGADLESVPGVVNVPSVYSEDLAGHGELEDGRAGLDGHGHPMFGELFAHPG